MIPQKFALDGLRPLLALAGASVIQAGASTSSGRGSSANRVAPSADEIKPLLVGAKVPNVVFKNIDDKEIKIHSLIKRRPTVLVYYRGGWCPFCNLQLSQLHGIEDEVLSLGYQIVAVSADRPSNAASSVVKHSIRYTLLSDNTMEGAKAFGLAFKLDGEGLERAKAHGVNLEEASGFDHHILPVPAVFVLDKSGTILFEYINPDYHVRLNAKVLLAILKAEDEAASDRLG